MYVILLVMLLVRFDSRNVVMLFIFLMVMLWCSGVMFFMYLSSLLKFLMLDVVSVLIGLVEMLLVWMFFGFSVLVR